MDLLKKDYNSKITEIKNKIRSITGLATSSALNAVENKIPDIRSLVNRTDYTAKILNFQKKFTDHNHDKYITNSECNNLVAKTFTARLARES